MAPGTEKRGRPRVPKRMTCEIATPDGQRSTGLVQDVSRCGLFIQTGAIVRTNSLVQVIFPARDGRRGASFEAGVARRRQVARQLAASVRAGLGLEIIPPRAAYEEWIDRAADLTNAHDYSDGPAVEAEKKIRAFRFRLTHHDGLQTQILTVRCESEPGARARALARAGRQWKISHVQPL